VCCPALNTCCPHSTNGYACCGTSNVSKREQLAKLRQRKVSGIISSDNEMNALDKKDARAMK
jgi:hypothetical protein